MYWGYYYFDPAYLAVIAAMLLSMLASGAVNGTFKKYSRVRTRSGITGAEAARRVLAANGVHGVRIERVSGNLTDHYDPKSNAIRLSDGVYDAATPAAVGVAAHEAGHAVQYAVGYAPIKLRSAIVSATNIGSRFSGPLILIGLVMMSLGSVLGDFFYYVALLGALCYGMCVVFQLVTLPTEFNASRRAVRAIEQCDLLTAEESRAAKKVLRAAALTYVAALSVTLTQFARLLLLIARRRRD